ncbi:MAG TPA: tetratricopeptide repeat protein, partial [Longimicrobiales bacterium]
MLRSTCCLIVFTLSLLHPLAAQRKSAAPVDATQVRVELAAVLLQSRRYDEAAREYGAILVRQPNNFAARLGLARALAWGERFREAEAELRVLRGQRPRDRDVLTLLRSTRENLEPRAVEAGMWLAEEPNYQPYRVILARALMREGKPREAIGHYEWLLSLNPHNILARHGLATAL